MSCKLTLYKTGVYEIVNTFTNERYIGSATRIGKSSSLSGFYVRFEKQMLKNKYIIKECALK